MTTTIERLASRTVLPIVLAPGEVLNVQAGLRFKDGTPAIPWLVKPVSNCPFLNVLQSNANGTFDIHNPTSQQASFTFVAHHLHSEEREPIGTITPEIIPSTVPAPQVCALQDQNPRSIHARYTQETGIQLPFLQPYLRVPFDVITALLEETPPFVEWSADLPGRFLINRSGRYQIIARANAYIDAEDQSMVINAMISDPDGAMNLVLPMYDSKLISGSDSYQAVMETIIEIDEADPVADRTFEIQQGQLGTEAYSGQFGPLGGSIQITRLND